MTPRAGFQANDDMRDMDSMEEGQYITGRAPAINVVGCDDTADTDDITRDIAEASGMMARLGCSSSSNSLRRTNSSLPCRSGTEDSSCSVLANMEDSHVRRTASRKGTADLPSEQFGWIDGGFKGVFPATLFRDPILRTRALWRKTSMQQSAKPTASAAEISQYRVDLPLSSTRMNSRQRQSRSFLSEKIADNMFATPLSGSCAGGGFL